jgi:hypothetical protein
MDYSNTYIPSMVHNNGQVGRPVAGPRAAPVGLGAGFTGTEMTGFVPHRPSRPEKSEGGIRFKLVSDYQPQMIGRHLSVRSIEFETSRVGTLFELHNQRCMVAHKTFDNGRGLVAATQPNDLRRRAAQGSDIGEVRIERNDRKAFATGELPDGIVARAVEPGSFYLLGFWKYIRQHAAETVAQVLIEEQLHAGAVTMRRSRSAA